MNLSDNDILKSYTSRYLNMEFSNQVRNVFSNEPAEINLCIKDKNIKIVLTDDTFDIENPISLLTEAIYIDDPCILDDTANHFYHLASYHREQLRKKLLSDEQSNVVDELLLNKKLENIYKILNTVCDGSIEKNKNGGITYRKKDSSKALNFAVLSTGLKSFVILKTLIQKGAIESNGTVILDEPEVHLHPKWQLLFAQLIVLLHKEFNLHILINTHSPYFLNAIETYSQEYGVSNKCNYYSAVADESSSIIKDVTNNTEEIYAKLAQPLQELENIRYRNLDD